MAFRSVLDNDTNMKSVICYFKFLASSTRETTSGYICMLTVEVTSKAQHENAS